MDRPTYDEAIGASRQFSGNVMRGKRVSKEEGIGCPASKNPQRGERERGERTFRGSKVQGCEKMWGRGDMDLWGCERRDNVGSLPQAQITPDLSGI